MVRKYRLNILLFVAVSRFCSHILPTKLYLDILFFLRFGERINWKAPQTYNEKIQALKYSEQDISLQTDVDKYEVRQKIRELIGEEYLVPIYGVFEKPEEIHYEALPNSFVLKCTHGTHCSIVCRNKERLDILGTNKKLSKWLKHNYYYDAREWPYKNIKPRIICERLLGSENEALVDYKFMCFDGKVKLILVHQDINNEKGKHTLDIYTPEWELTEIEWGIPRMGRPIPKPERMDECINISERLSAGRPHVRVDLYIVDNRIYFGELTYYTAAGFKPFKNKEDDYLLGSWIHLEKGRYA